MRDPLCDILGIEYPVLQGGMAWVATAELAAAVSAAGGLGVLGSGNAPPELLQREIRRTRELTRAPFGVNIYYMSPFAEEYISLVIAEKVPVVTTGAGNPGKHLPLLKEAGIRVIPVVSSVALARRLVKLGVDALVAEGSECGGHTGDLGSLVLVPQVVDAVDVPVIAAGGIAEGRGFRAARELGAQGVQMGTRFVCSRECTVHANYKQAIIEARDRDTVVTGASIGHPVRVLKNRFAREFQEMEQRGASVEELEEFGTGKLRAAVVDGDVRNGSVMLGQVAGMIQDELTASEIIARAVG